MDRIWLKGISCQSRIGVSSAERKHRQKILIDVCLEVSARSAAATDDVRKTVDYTEIERVVLALAQGDEYRLIETLAERIAEIVLKNQPLIKALTVRVHKAPSVMLSTREVLLEINRSRHIRRRNERFPTSALK